MNIVQWIWLQWLLFNEFGSNDYSSMNLAPMIIVQVMEMDAITRAARLGRTLGEYQHYRDIDQISSLSWQLSTTVTKPWSCYHRNNFLTCFFFFCLFCLFCFFLVFFVFGNDNFAKRILPPNGVPGAGRAAADGDGLPRRLRGDAWLRRQLRLHLPRLVHLPLPSFTHGRNVFQSAKIDLALHTQQQQSLLIPCCSKQPCTLCKAKCDNDCYCVS